MTSHDNTYSRFIAWTKIILPLGALALLSTLFLFSRGGDGRLVIPFSDRDIAERARTPRVTEPNFAGVSPNGTAVSIFAETATPDPQNPQVMDAEQLHASVNIPGGTRFEISSARGNLDGSARTFSLTEGVEVNSTNGLHMETGILNTTLDGTILHAPGDVVASSPFGDFQAGEMLLELSDRGNNSYVLVFKGGVKLIYTPQD